jgi:preprotein translocase subunit SecA
MSRTLSHGSPLPALQLYPERDVHAEKTLDRIAATASSAVAARIAPLFERRLSDIVAKVGHHGNLAKVLSDQELREFAAKIRAGLVKHRFNEALVAQSFAVVREVATRTIGQRHYDVQLIGGFALLKGMIAEMETGEGKTLTATLAACTASLAGFPVHVVTVNDYLVQRDAELMAPNYRWL